MSTLHLLRHAEAQWQAPGPGGDHARRLSARGVQQARGVGAHLRGAGVSLILASSATRTLQTAEALGLGVPIWSTRRDLQRRRMQILEELLTVPDGYNAACWWSVTHRAFRRWRTPSPTAHRTPRPEP